MLFSIDSDSYIEKIPHRSDYDRWRKGISDADYQAIFDHLTSRISESQIETSSWIPGRDWTGTVFDPIYTNACHCDEIAAAKFFGLILWHVMLEHQETWAFGRYKLGEIPIEGLTYFRINVPKSKVLGGGA